MPNIPVRDLVIQKDENDLVLGTFGRGIYILDDYTPLRYFESENSKNESILFSPKDGLWYIQKEFLEAEKSIAR